MGAALGFIGLTRYYSSILFFGSFLIFLLCTRPRKQLSVFLWISLRCRSILCSTTALPIYYNRACLADSHQWGHPELILFNLQFPSMRLMRHAAKLIEINAVELTEFSSPILLLLYGVALFVKASKKALQFYDFFFIAFVIGYVLWVHDPGNQIWPSVLLRCFPIPYTDCDLRGSPYNRQHKGTHHSKRDSERPHSECHLVAMRATIHWRIYL